jgi:hypothetical protein
MADPANNAADQTPQNGDPAGSKRVNVIFSPQQYQVLKALAEQQGINVSDVLRQALALTKIIAEAEQNNEKFLIEKNGQLQQLRLVR